MLRAVNGEIVFGGGASAFFYETFPLIGTDPPSGDRVEADKGEGGFTYRVCFESKQAKGQRTRVEVRS